MSKQKKILYSLGSLPYDSLGEVLTYLDYFKDVQSVCFAVKGFYEYIKCMNYNCCRNVCFRVKRECILPSNRKIIQRNPIVLRLKHSVPFMNAAQPNVASTFYDDLPTLAQLFRMSFPHLKKLELSFFALESRDEKQLLAGNNALLIEDFENLESFVIRNPPNKLELKNLPKFRNFEINRYIGKKIGTVSQFHYLPEIVMDMNRVQTLKILNYGLLKTDWDLLITDEYTKNLTFSNVVFDFRKRFKEDNKPMDVDYAKVKKQVFLPPRLEKLELTSCNHFGKMNKYYLDMTQKRYLSMRRLSLRNNRLITSLLHLNFDGLENLEFIEGDLAMLNNYTMKNSKLPREIMVVLRELKKLRTLKISARNRYSDLNFHMLEATTGYEISRIPNLQRLTMDITGNFLSREFEYLPKITFLETTLNSGDSLDEMDSLTSLRVKYIHRSLLLDIFDCYKIVPMRIQHQLVRLDLNIIQETDNAHIVLEEKNFPNLKSFIHGREQQPYNYNDDGYAFLNIEIRLPNLRYLELRYCKFLNLVHAPNLRTLSLDGSDKCKDFVQIRFADEMSRNIRVLDLFSNKEDRPTLFRFRSKNWFAYQFNFLEVFGNLEELYLKNCTIEQLEKFDGKLSFNFICHITFTFFIKRYFQSLKFFKFTNIPFSSMENVDENKRLR